MSRCYCNCDDCCHYKEDLDGTDVLARKDELLRECAAIIKQFNEVSTLACKEPHLFRLKAIDLITRIRKEVDE